ncbi:MAG: hypothetical protein ACRDSN_17120, partial [Pseudonocardiaceae bacterium]
QFTALESRRDQLQRTMGEKNLANVRRLEHQYDVLSATLFPMAEQASTATEARPILRGIS